MFYRSSTKALLLLVALLLILAQISAAPASSAPEKRWLREIQLGRQALSETHYSAAIGHYQTAMAETVHLTEVHRAEVLGDIGVVYRTTFQYAKAEKNFSDAIEIFERHQPQSLGDLAATSANLAQTYLLERKVAPAEVILQAAKRAVEKRYGRHNFWFANLLNMSAQVAQAKADTCSAEADFTEALAILGEDPSYAISRAAVLTNVALLHLNLHDYAAAEREMTLSLKLYQALLPPDHPDRAVALGNMGLVLLARGNTAKGVSLLKQSVRLNEQIFGLHSLQVSNALENLGISAGKTGNYVVAEAYFLRALRIRLDHVGRESPLVAAILIDEAIMDTGRSHFENADKLLARAMAIQLKNFPPLDAEIGKIYRARGQWLAAQGRWAEAIKAHQLAVDILERFAGVVRLEAAAALDDIGQCYSYQGDHPSAVTAYQKSLDYKIAVLGRFNAELVGTLSRAAQELHATGAHEKARDYETQAEQIVRAQRGDN